MTQDERDALTAERIDLQRKYTKSLGTAGYGARARKLAEMIEAIDAQLDPPTNRFVTMEEAIAGAWAMSEPQPDEPTTEIESLAGKTLGDPDATETEKSLAASVLARSGD